MRCVKSVVTLFDQVCGRGGSLGEPTWRFGGQHTHPCNVGGGQLGPSDFHNPINNNNNNRDTISRTLSTPLPTALHKTSISLIPGFTRCAGECVLVQRCPFLHAELCSNPSVDPATPVCRGASF